MSSSANLFERSQRVSPGGVHSPVRAFKSVGGNPIFFRSAAGATLTSVEGRTYIDFCQSFGPNILGHRDPDVAAVVRETVETAWSLGACEPYSLELAEWITGRVRGLEKVRFVCSGTEAVMSALRVARAASGRPKVLKFEGCYHGHVDALLVKAGSGLAGRAASDSAGVSDELAQTTLVAPLDNEAEVERVFREYGREIGTVILEPMPANFGLLLQRREFLNRVFELARDNGSLILFDEVISGFRVAMGGMAEILGFEPDLVTYGKIMGGGFPVGAYGGRSEIMNLVAPLGPVYQAGTLAANPIGMRAGLATLQKMERVGVHRVLEERTAQFCAELSDFFDRGGYPLTVARMASVFWIHTRTGKPIRSLLDFAPDHGERFKPFFHACLKRGLYLAPSAYEVNFVSLAHTPEILGQALEGLKEAVKEVYA